MIVVLFWRFIAIPISININHRGVDNFQSVLDHRIPHIYESCHPCIENIAWHQTILHHRQFEYLPASPIPCATRFCREVLEWVPKTCFWIHHNNFPFVLDDFPFSWSIVLQSHDNDTVHDRLVRMSIGNWGFGWFFLVCPGLSCLSRHTPPLPHIATNHATTITEFTFSKRVLIGHANWTIGCINQGWRLRFSNGMPWIIVFSLGVSAAFLRAIQAICIISTGCYSYTSKQVYNIPSPACDQEQQWWWTTFFMVVSSSTTLNGHELVAKK